MTPADLDVHPGVAKVLKAIRPHDGYVTFEQFGHLGRDRASKELSHACSIGALRRASPYERVLKMRSVKFWRTQINEPGHKNTTPGSSTKQVYLNGISRFDEWLRGRSFPSYRSVVSDGEIVRQGIDKSFASLEELMEYCIESDHGTKTAQRVIREYLAIPQVAGASASVQKAARSAIKSYFNAHDIVINLPKPRKKRADPAPDGDTPMTLEDFYRMLQNGNPSMTMRTIMLIKLQSGMDSSTLTDRFNHEGYSQLVKYFKTDDHKSWNLDACPAPIRLVRVKTNVQYTTFLDRDAVAQLQEYLTWKGARHGKHDATKPIFMTMQNTPIHPAWLSGSFSKVAVRAGIQEKISRKVYKIRAHEVRDLLKSTLLASGCKQYAADHVLGHAPRDSYEKEAVLYPEELRAEYAKASSRINIFSRVEGTLNGPKDSESQDARIRELEAQVAASTTANAEIALLERRHQKSMRDLYKVIESLKEKIDSLQHDAVGRA